MKKLIFIILCLVCTSCIKDIDLPFEKTDHALVVNCLFSEDANWKVILSRVKSYNEKKETYVSDARVGIVPEGQDTIRLNNEGNGIYSAESRPVKGIQYQLVVKDQGKIFRAKSAIPTSIKVSSVQVTGQHTVFYSTSNLSDFDVLPVDMEVAPGDKQSFVRMRFYSLNTNNITRYIVTNTTIETLRQKKFPEDFLSDLSSLIGKQISGFDIKSVLYNIMYKYKIYSDRYENDLLPAIEKIEVGPRDETTFEIGLIFSNSSWLSNVSRDKFNVLGELTQPRKGSLFVSYYPVMNKNESAEYTEEYWLEVVTMSEDYYKYQKTYINQVTNISNPFSSATEVYTNIENGVGIFAGYNKQLIHFKDY